MVTLTFSSPLSMLTPYSSLMILKSDSVEKSWSGRSGKRETGRCVVSTETVSPSMLRTRHSSKTFVPKGTRRRRVVLLSASMTPLNTSFEEGTRPASTTASEKPMTSCRLRSSLGFET